MDISPFLNQIFRLKSYFKDSSIAQWLMHMKQPRQRMKQREGELGKHRHTKK